MPYSGIFIRQWIGQTPGDVSHGTCGCPDIILNGLSDVANPPGPAQFTTQAAYGVASAANVYLNQPNYVYLRGLQSNTTAGSNLFFYYVPSNLAMWPQNWMSTHVLVGSQENPQNWVYAPPTPGNNVLVTSEPMVWTPPTIDVNAQHYCTIAWADNQPADSPVPPDLAHWSHMQSFDELMTFLAQHPNMGWRNTTDYLTPPPDGFVSTEISTEGRGELVNVTVNFNNITDGTFMVNLVGDVHYTSGPTPLNVANYLGGYQLPQLQFQAKNRALLQVTYAKGPSTMSPFANVSADIVHVVTPRMLETLLAISTPPGRTLPLAMRTLRSSSTVAAQTVYVIGRQQWNLKYGAPAA